jgi:aminopeptidase
MTNPLMQKWAKILVHYSVPVNPGNSVVIMGGVEAEPLLRAVYAEVVAAGGHPVMVPTFTGIESSLLNHGSDDQLTWLDPIERYWRENADVAIRIVADSNTRALSNVDPARQAIYQGARRPLVDTFIRREIAGTLRWTITQYPTDAFAQDAEMSTEDFAAFVFNACKLDTADPVAAWTEQSHKQQILVDWLTGKREIRLTGPGTDLTVDVTGRTWINADGHKNFPDGEVFTGPVETGAEGHVTFDMPAMTQGRRVEGIRLKFENGKVVDATAASNEEFLLQQLDIDDGARYLGEFAFGTNFGIQQFTGQLLFDEKIGGTVHMALGAGLPTTGNTNQSAIHWDMICDLRQGGRVTVDGEPFLVDGSYLLWQSD